jgi:small subunit ribosomal protein S8
MSVTDPIADMLTAIRNAARAQHKRLDIPASNLKKAVLEVLQREKYISSYRVVADARQGILRVYLKYSADEKSVITGIERVSTPGRRVYVGSDEIPRVQGGLGTSVLSTPRGVMTDKEARQAKLGGELLCRIW